MLSSAPTRCESSITRMVAASPSVRGVEPVARASRPYSMRSPSTSSTVCAAGSIAATSVDSRSSTSSSRHSSSECM